MKAIAKNSIKGTESLISFNTAYVYSDCYLFTKMGKEIKYYHPQSNDFIKSWNGQLKYLSFK